MRNQLRNNRKIEYQLYEGKTPLLDDNGWETGETQQSYSEKVEAMVNISAAIGNTQIEAFGNLIDYDHIIVTHDKNLPINESSIVWYDNERYIVRRVAKSLNCISIAIAKSETQNED